MTALEQMERRMTALDVEIAEFRGQGQVALTCADIMKRYCVGQAKAYQIIRAIRSVCGGGKLGQGKVLPSEVRYWESLVDTTFVERL
ncbi:MAG: hypothetical protein E7667_03620 [Ruminococcaceae bacterium]|nr:hypothetical protein [Oscillospiraceae bacterium]